MYYNRYVMTRNNLTMHQAQEIARLFRDRRAELGLSVRAVASQAGVSPSYVNVLEHAARLAPRPDLLKAVAEALEISSSDLFAIADWLPRRELPSLQPYLRAKYGLGSRDAAEIDDYLTRLQARRGGGSGPVDREDEH